MKKSDIRGIECGKWWRRWGEMNHSQNESVPLISVIIPVYNVEKYLPECMSSVCGQSYKNLEILLIDDGSTDESGRICDQWREKDSRIKVIHQENRGLSAARNAGLEVCRGEYITFVDSDDCIKNRFIQCGYEISRQYQADIVCFGFRSFTDAKELDGKRRSGRKKIKVLNREEAMKAWLYKKYYNVAAWGKLYRKEMLEKIFFPEGKLHEDVGCTWKCFLKAGCVACSNEEMYGYRVRKGSIKNSDFKRQRLDYLTFTEEIMDVMDQKYPEYKNASVSRHFQGCVQILKDMPLTEEWRSERSQIEKQLKVYCGQVVRDSEARVIYRAIALLCVISQGLTGKLLRKR